MQRSVLRYGNNAPLRDDYGVIGVTGGLGGAEGKSSRGLSSVCVSKLKNTTVKSFPYFFLYMRIVKCYYRDNFCILR